MPRPRLGIVFGGASEEHPVSVKSAREVARHLDGDRYDAVWIGITRGGEWRLCDGPAGDWEDAGRPAVLSPDAGTRGLLAADGVVALDVVLPLLHGRYGEDGSIQGLLELSGIPYVGCDVQSSALSMDKSLAYAVAGRVGVATPRFRVLAPVGPADVAGLRYPLFVKPARSGSSFGVTRVADAAELDAAVRVARRYDSKVLLEEAVEGSEVGCAILGEDPDLVVGAVDRIALSSGFFRIHQEQTPEQGSDNATVTVPAPIGEPARTLVQETAATVYRALGCSGLARVDLFLTVDGRVVLNEVNTMPGLTSYSRYPRMMAAAGLSLADVIDRAVAAALARARR